MKACSKCKEVTDDFHKGAYYCKPCANKQTRDWYKANIHKPEVRRAKRNDWIKSKYSITVEEYEAKLWLQNGQCKICSIELLPGNFTHLDHNHTTGKIRDFLCTNCNRGLGHFQDTKELLMKAAAYLESHTDDGNQKEGRRL